MKNLLLIVFAIITLKVNAQSGLHIKWVNDSTVIYYDRSGTIWKQNLNSRSRFKLLGGSQPALNPTNENLIAYRTRQNGKSTILVKNLSNEDLFSINSKELEGLNAFHPIWSFDGTKIAFNAESSENKSSNLFIYDYVEKRLTRHLPDLVVGAPAFFPNGDVLIGVQKEKGTTLIRYDASTGESNTLLSTNHKIFFADASHDGRRVAYTHDGYGNREIIILDLEANNSERITQTSYDEYSPRWSADGDRLVYFANINGKYPAFILNLKTKESVNLTR